MNQTDGSLVLGEADAGEILTLQRAAYVTEAQLHGDLRMPPLAQSLPELLAELADPDVTAFGYREAGRLVAAVRVRILGPVARIGRLCVVPDLQGRGLGTALLNAVHARLPAEVTRTELFTGEHSAANLRLYARLGYVETHRQDLGGYQLVFMSRSRR